MSCREPVRAAGSHARSSALRALLAVAAAFVGVLAYQSLASWSSSAPVPAVTGTEFDLRTEPGRSDSRPATGLGEADGVLPDGVTVFDDQYPAVAKLDPALLGALRRAATEAAKGGIDFHVDSGWRSTSYQRELLRQAVAKYGSEKEAARWVATPQASAHVSGDAIDIGPGDATAWLSKHGARYGLCQIYGNEPWHYELRPEAVDRGCPRLYADPAHDPRMQQ